MLIGGEQVGENVAHENTKVYSRQAQIATQCLEIIVGKWRRLMENTSNIFVTKIVVFVEVRGSWHRIHRFVVVSNRTRANQSYRCISSHFGADDFHVAFVCLHKLRFVETFQLALGPKLIHQLLLLLVCQRVVSWRKLKGAAMKRVCQISPLEILRIEWNDG